MGKMNRKIDYLAGTVLLLAYAYFAKETARGIDSVFLETIVQFSRHLIHIGLLLAWILSVRQRIMQTSIRRYLMASGALLVFWLYIRTCKWMFFSDVTWPARYCWYAYYVAMILVPLFGVFLVQYLGKTEEFELSQKWKLLYLPAACLLALVFTNDLHQLVFQFPSGAPFSDTQYTYGPGYFLVSGWSILLGLYFVAALLWKCRAPGKRWFQRLPLLVMLAEVGVTVCYCLQILKCDLTALDVIMIVLLLESCIQSGLIRSNSNYDRLFEGADIEAQITDRWGQICYLSGQTQQDDAQVRTWMTNAEQEGTILDGKRLKCADLKNGKVLWWEDISEILAFTEELEKVGKQLSEKNDLLKAELELREKQLHVAEKNRLYDGITREVTGQLDQLERLLHEPVENEKKRMAHICVLSAYIKRRSNLRLLSENAGNLQTKELEYCLKESIECLRMYGVMASLDSDCHGETKAEYVIGLYDVFERLTEQVLDHTNAMLLKLQATGEKLTLRIQMDPETVPELPDDWEIWKALGGKAICQKTEDAVWLIFQI